MKLFKITDIVLSLVMIILFTIKVATAGSPDWIFIGYFTTGGWQIISMIIHALNSWHTRKWDFATCITGSPL